jgi:hypothetical protein
VGRGVRGHATPASRRCSDRIDAFVESECGIVDTDDDETISDEQLQEQLEESGRGNELATQAFVAAGLPEDQAACLGERISFDDLLEVGASGGEPPASFVEALDDCGVSLSQLLELAPEGDLGGDTGAADDLGGDVESDLEGLIEEMPEIEDLPDLGDGLDTGDIPAEAVEIFVSTLVQQGFTEAEAQCLAPTFLGAAASGEAGDPLAAFEACGISLSRLAELNS